MVEGFLFCWFPSTPLFHSASISVAVLKVSLFLVWPPRALIPYVIQLNEQHDSIVVNCFKNMCLKTIQPEFQELRVDGNDT